MSGRPPIDRVREAEDAPRIYEEHKQRFTERQARLRDVATTPQEIPATPAADDRTEGDDA